MVCPPPLQGGIAFQAGTSKVLQETPPPRPRGTPSYSYAPVRLWRLTPNGQFQEPQRSPCAPSTSGISTDHLWTARPGGQQPGIHNESPALSSLHLTTGCAGERVCRHLLPCSTPPGHSPRRLLDPQAPGLGVSWVPPGEPYNLKKSTK